MPLDLDAIEARAKAALQGPWTFDEIAPTDDSPYVDHWWIGIQWMSRSEMAEAVPPAYTEFIGDQLAQHLTVVA